MQQGKIRKNWKLRWLELHPDRLDYFKPSPRPILKGSIPLKEVGTMQKDTDVRALTLWPVRSYPPAQESACRWALGCDGRMFFFVAPTGAECTVWLDKIRGAKAGTFKRASMVRCASHTRIVSTRSSPTRAGAWPVALPSLPSFRLQFDQSEAGPTFSYNRRSSMKSCRDQAAMFQELFEVRPCAPVSPP